MSAYFSLGASVESRKKKRGNLPSFSPCTLLKARSGPHNLNSALSFLFARNRTEMLATQAKKTG